MKNAPQKGEHMFFREGDLLGSRFFSAVNQDSPFVK